MPTSLSHGLGLCRLHRLSRRRLHRLNRYHRLLQFRHLAQVEGLGWSAKNAATRYVPERVSARSVASRLRCRGLLLQNPQL